MKLACRANEKVSRKKFMREKNGNGILAHGKLSTGPLVQELDQGGKITQESHWYIAPSDLRCSLFTFI
jgi:hypothetical protein